MSPPQRTAERAKKGDENESVRVSPPSHRFRKIRGGMNMFARKMSSVLFLAVSVCSLAVAHMTYVALGAVHNCCTQRHVRRFSDWSEPFKLGGAVSSGSDDFHPSIS